MDGAGALDYLSQCVEAGYHQPFRGEISEYAGQLDLQAGYAVKGPLQMETLRHLLAPLRALRAPEVRLISVRGAVQTTKSLLADIFVPYVIEHDPGDLLWLMEDDKKAREYAERAIALAKSVPGISELLMDVDRSDKTKTALKFRHMKVLLAGLNPGNVQSLSWRYVIVDETWLHPRDGLLRQAMYRTKQYPDTKKILLIGQGGWEDDDHDREHKETWQLELHYDCPKCGKPQPFEQTRQRPDDFPIAELRGTYAGLGWDTNENTRPNGRWDFEEASQTAHHRCFYCDHRIEDTPDIRRRLNDSYRYFPAGREPITEAGKPGCVWPPRVGFHWPAEASMRVPFRDLVSKYLRAKVAQEEQGYMLPMQEYYQRDRGISWNEALEGETVASVREDYDPKAAWSDEVYRPLIVDCQRDLKKFYYTAFGIARSGDSRELRRGIAASWDDLAGIQAELKIKDQHVFVDCGYRMTEVLRECVRHGHAGQVRVGKSTKTIWLCWTGMKGSGYELFRHINPRTKLDEWRIYSDRKFYDTNIGTSQRQPRSPWYEWSNLHCKDLLRARRDGEPGAPKYLTLADPLPSSDQNSYFAQMRSERRVENYHGGRKRAIWIPIKETRPNHFWDIGAMLMAFMAIVGIVGAPEEGSA